MFSTISIRVVLFAATLAFAGAWQEPADMAGRWVGSIDTDAGQMEIALQLTHADGTFSGQLETAHGGWPVTSVTSKDGEWTIAFGTTEEGGRIVGRVTGARFTGRWETHMAKGTFDLVKARRR